MRTLEDQMTEVIKKARKYDQLLRMPRMVPICTFCGMNQDQVKKLIAGPGVYICDACVGLCNEILEDEKDEQDNREETQHDRHNQNEV